MANPSKARGTKFESACADYFRSAGFSECYRMADGGEHDAGDLGGLPQVAAECRDRARLDLAGNVADANRRALEKDVPFGVTIMKKRGASIADAYVACDLETFTRILHALNG